MSNNNNNNNNNSELYNYIKKLNKEIFRLNKEKIKNKNNIENIQKKYFNKIVDKYKLYYSKNLLF